MAFRDANADLAGLLLDLAAVHEGTPRHWGYRRAARVLRHLPVQIDDLAESDRAAISGIGPATLRIVGEFLEQGASPAVEQAVENSPRRSSILLKRAARARFLSAAAVARVLQAPLPGVVGLADCRGDSWAVDCLE